MKKSFLLLAILFLSIPFSFSQWQQTAGPSGGEVNCFLVNGNNLFAGTSGGAFLSTNNGSSWTAVNNGLPRAARPYSLWEL